MLDNTDALFRIIDLKQYQYCPRIFYYHTCLPQVRPITGKMEMGIEAHESEPSRAARRQLTVLALEGGIRYFGVHVVSRALNLTGQIDEVIEVESPTHILVPVDYKLSRTAAKQYKVQLAAYAMLLEAQFEVPVTTGYLYLMPLRRAEPVPISRALRNSVKKALESMFQIANREQMPPPTPAVCKCAGCEFRRFCNDVV